MTDRFVPAPLLHDADAQTIFANLWRPRPGPPMVRVRWELEDGDFLDLDRAAGPTPEAPVAILCHGLEGSSTAPYIRGLARALVARGLAVAALNFRTCGGEPNRLLRSYHSGETTDLGEVVRRLLLERPGRPVVVAGFSLGGNVVTKWLGEHGEALPGEVRGGAAISVPFDLGACQRRIDGPGAFSWIYRERFMRRLRRKAALKARRFPGVFDNRALARATTFGEYDQLMTAPAHGFASREDYYQRCSAGRFVAGIRRPYLALSAADDPMVPAESLPVAAAGTNPFVRLVVTPHGGHTGFVDGTPLRPGFWAERNVADFLAGLAGGDAGATASRP
jgi:predicted alpha/beta-fold hydrolase